MHFRLHILDFRYTFNIHFQYQTFWYKLKTAFFPLQYATPMPGSGK
jgi:hypothetical protein